MSDTNKEQSPQDFPWYKSYDEGVRPRLDYEEIPIFEYLDRAARTQPKRPAIRFRNWKMSYAKLQRTAEVMAANLRKEGITPGDRVAVMLPNLPQTIITYWAVLKAGAVVTMVNPLYMEKELVHQVTDAGCKAMITLDHLWPKVSGFRDRLGVQKYFVTRISDCLSFPLNHLYRFKAKRDGLPVDVDFDGESVQPWKGLLKGTERCKGSVTNPREELALLQYTGGTTGVSKGVMLTHFNLAANVQQCQGMLESLKDDPQIFLALLPLFHVYGLTVCLNFTTSLAATIVPYPRYVPKDLLDGIAKFKPTVFPGAPSVYMSLLQQKSIDTYDLSCIKCCISGSAPLPVDIYKRFREKTGATIVEGYGLTEASPITHLTPFQKDNKPGSIGLPFPDTEARIVDMEVGTLPLQPGKIGELVIRAPQVMKGYWNRPDETASTLRNGWLYTGDIAYMDDDGYFFIQDRKKDMILCGGYNVYPREIDEVLHEHPKIKEAVAVGIPHHARGEIIKAYIVPEPGYELDKAEVLAFCRAQLANYKVPKQVEFRTELPKTIVGKVLRRALRDEEIAKMKEKRTKKK